MFLTSPDLLHPSIAHGFFTRKGGVSEGIYGSLNCGWGSSDAKTNVRENRKRVAETLGTIEAHLCSLYQVHGSKVITVTDAWSQENKPQADAMVTTLPGLALGILTADCAPVLFADKTKNIIGAAHAGWKGAVAGVLGETVAAMQALGAQVKNITATIGPCIAQPSYEVSGAFYDMFLQASPTHGVYFIPAVRPGHFLFDLRAYVKDRLKDAGLAAINILENDTYLEEDAFFSFRRTTHRAEPDYGRHITAIMIKK